jgi:hypothetical protein
MRHTRTEDATHPAVREARRALAARKGPPPEHVWRPRPSKVPPPLPGQLDLFGRANLPKAER